MKHPEIEQLSIVEHYVTGKLTAAQVESFEEHYLDCPECIRAVEDAERLHRGLRMAASEDLVTRGASVMAAWRILRSRAGVAMAAVVLAAGVVVSGLLWQQIERLSGALDSARHALSEERRPRINTPILSLVPTRTGEQPLRQISLLAEPEWLVFAIELGEGARESYEATLTSATGTTVWQASGLEPNFQGTVSMSFHSSSLPPGSYELDLVAEQHTLRFPLRVTGP